MSGARLGPIKVVAYDPDWPDLYAAERSALLRLGGAALLTLEHIGSTAVPGLPAKPVIDMMAAVAGFDDARVLAARLAGRGYAEIDTGMTDRLFLHRRARPDLSFHLHLVERQTWDERHERLMRDYLIAHPQLAAAYGELKGRLAQAHAHDRGAYTRAKTDFVQDVVARARAALGLPSIDVWPA